MTEQQLKNIFIEYGANVLKAECMSFCNFYQLKNVEIDYTMQESFAELYLIDNKDRFFIGELDFAGAAIATRNPGPWVDKPFTELVKKYDLKPPQPEITVIPDNPDEVTDEMKERKATDE
jgi:hypothetical protein